jgi:hypothetical protein
MRQCNHRRRCAEFREQRRLSLSRFDSILQAYYLPHMQALLNNSTIFWSRMSYEPDIVSTKTFTIPLTVNKPVISPWLPEHYRPKSNG